VSEKEQAAAVKLLQKWMNALDQVDDAGALQALRTFGGAELVDQLEALRRQTREFMTLPVKPPRR